MPLLRCTTNRWLDWPGTERMAMGSENVSDPNAFSAVYPAASAGIAAGRLSVVFGTRTNCARPQSGRASMRHRIRVWRMISTKHGNGHVSSPFH